MKKSRPKLSLCMVLRDEEKLLPSCLSTVYRHVDEIIVILDSRTTDATEKLAKSFGAHVIRSEWNGNEGGARNKALKNATGDWVLVLDGDERIARGDVQKLREIIRSSKAKAFYLTLRDYSREFNLLDHWRANDGRYLFEERFSGCAGFSKRRVLRLFRNLKHIRYEEGLSRHVTPVGSFVNCSGKIASLPVVVHHFQFLKGGEEAVLKKVRERLRNELRHLVHSPKNPWYIVNVATSYYSLGEYKKAKFYLSKAFKKNGDRARILFMKGLVLFHEGRYKEARREFQQVLTLKGPSKDLLTALGITNFLCNDIRTALRCLRKANRGSPNPIARNALGVLYETMGNYVEAERCYEQTKAINPYFLTAQRNLKGLHSKKAIR